MARTRKVRIETLERRLDYLVRKRDEFKVAGRPYGYLTDEIEALEWALPILRDHRAAALVTGGARSMPRPEVVARAAQSREDSLQMGEEVVAALDAEVRRTHPYGFRSGEWARVLTTVESRGRACWLVRFPDGVTDWWVIEDPDAVYELRGETPNGPREVRGP
jgi:hypothetical protein